MSQRFLRAVEFGLRVAQKCLGGSQRLFRGLKFGFGGSKRFFRGLQFGFGGSKRLFRGLKLGLGGSKRLFRGLQFGLGGSKRLFRGLKFGFGGSQRLFRGLQFGLGGSERLFRGFKLGLGGSERLFRGFELLFGGSQYFQRGGKCRLRFCQLGLRGFEFLICRDESLFGLVQLLLRLAEQRFGFLQGFFGLGQLRARLVQRGLNLIDAGSGLIQLRGGRFGVLVEVYDLIGVFDQRRARFLEARSRGVEFVFRVGKLLLFFGNGFGQCVELLVFFAQQRHDAVIGRLHLVELRFQLLDARFERAVVLRALRAFRTFRAARELCGEALHLRAELVDRVLVLTGLGLQVLDFLFRARFQRQRFLVFAQELFVLVALCAHVVFERLEAARQVVVADLEFVKFARGGGGAGFQVLDLAV